MVKGETVGTMYIRKDYPECLPQARLERPYNNWAAPSLPKDPTLALCETESEVVHLAQATDLKIDALIALTPQAACQCHLMGVPYYKIEDFFDVSAFCVADEPMLRLQSRWSDEVDAFLWKANPDFEKYGFRPAGHYFFFLKILSDMLFRAAFGLAHLFVASQPKRVIYFMADGTDVIPSTLFFRSSVYTLILPACAKEYGVDLMPLRPCPRKQEDSARAAASGPPLRRFLGSVLPTPMVQALRRVRHKDLSGLLQLQIWGKETPTIIFKDSYDVRFMMQRAQRRGWRGELVSDVLKKLRSMDSMCTDLSHSLADWWSQIKAQPFFGEPFRWVGVDLCPIAKTRLRYWLYTVVPTMWQTLLQALAYFEVDRPEAVLLFSPSEPEDYGVLQAARSLGIPTITYQHGGFEGNCEYTVYDMTDLRHADYRLVYGDGTAAYLRERIARCAQAPAQIVTVGSARLDALRKGPDKRTRIRKWLHIAPSEQMVLYLPTSYQYNWYMARQAYLGVPYFQLLVQVVEILREFGQLQFVYRPFPELPRDPVAKVIAARCPNCQVVANIPVPELLQASDACIIDIPSTALLEALSTRKPLLIFADSRFVTLRSEARALLRKRMRLSETPEDYLKQLRVFLSQRRFEELEKPDREFLRMYGTHLDDGHSAERALKAVQEIIHEHTPRHVRVECQCSQ